MRVLHGPVNIGNQPWTLSRAERRQGHRSDVVVNYGTAWNFKADRVLDRGAGNNLLRKGRRAWFGATAPFRYDVLHYYFGRSFLAWEDIPRYVPGRHLDLKLGRWSGGKLFMTLQGCDVRLSDLSDSQNRITMCREGHCEVVQSCRSSLDASRRKLIKEILPWFHRVFVLNPELAHYVPGSLFLPYANVDLDQLERRYPRDNGSFVILHAPTDEAIKGSRFIIAAVERLKKRWPIEFLLIKNLPHEEAMKCYQRADLVIDQVLAGWYGGFAVEVMGMGKPVAGYIRDEDLGHIPAAMRNELPLIRLQLSTLEEDLERALQCREQWPDWGRQACEFVHRWHHPDWIASLMIQAYRDPQSKFVLSPRSSLVKAA